MKKALHLFLICCSVVLLFGFVWFAPFLSQTYAEGSDLEVDNISIQTLGLDKTGLSVYYDEYISGTYDSYTATLCKEDGTDFTLEEVEEGETPDSFDVVSADLPTGLTGLTVSNTGFTMFKPAQLSDKVFNFSLKVVFKIGENNYEKTATVQVLFHSLRIELIDNGTGSPMTELEVDLNDVKTEQDFVQYIDTSKTTIDVDDIDITFLSQPNFYVVDEMFDVRFSYTTPEGYMVDGQPFELTLGKQIYVTIVLPDDWAGFEIKLDNQGSPADTIDIGQKEYDFTTSTNNKISGNLTTNVNDGISFNCTSVDTENFIFNTTKEDGFGNYSFEIVPTQVLYGEYDFTITATFNDETSNPVVVSVEYIISTQPTLVLKNQTKTYDKGVLQEEVIQLLQNNIYSVLDVNGAVGLETDVVIDTTEITSVHPNPTDKLNCGNYVITYSYTSKICADKTVDVECTISVVDSVPQLLSSGIVATCGGQSIANGDRVIYNQPITIQISATEINNDDVVFTFTTQNAIVTSGDVNTTVTGVGEGEYEISSTTTSNQSVIVITLTPVNDYTGTLPFSVYCADATGPSQTVNFEIALYENEKPIIELDGDKLSGDISLGYSLQIDEDTTLSFKEYLKSVTDNVDTNVGISTTSIKLTNRQGQELPLALDRYTFTQAGEYLVEYSVQDASGNKSLAGFKIIVTVPENHAPVVTALVNAGEFGYKEEVVIDLSSHITDHESDQTTLLNGRVFTTQQGGGEQVFCIEKIATVGNTITIQQGETNNYVGMLFFTYQVVDSYGNDSNIGYIKVIFIDNIAPNITRVSKPTKFIAGNQEEISQFDMYGYFTGYDVIDNANITPTVVEKDGKTINLNATGTYTLVYTFEDASGNISTESVFIEIWKGNTPVIVVNEVSLNIMTGEEFDIYSFISQIQDTEDGNISSELNLNTSLVISGLPEDTNKAGTYNIKITYTDSDGNIAEQNFQLVITAPSRAWLWIVIGVSSAVGVAGITILIVFLVKRRYTRI